MVNNRKIGIVSRAIVEKRSSLSCPNPKTKHNRTI